MVSILGMDSEVIELFAFGTDIVSGFRHIGEVLDSIELAVLSRLPLARVHMLLGRDVPLLQPVQ